MHISTLPIDIAEYITVGVVILIMIALPIAKKLKFFKKNIDNEKDL